MKSSDLGMYLALAVMHTATASAAPITLVDNQVIIDNSPFFSVGPEDGLGGSNFALNDPDFIDIPYAIFDFGSTTAVSNATLTWNFGSLYGGSGPASIRLYVGSDVSGTITIADRFMGVAADTSTYSGGELKTFDLTSFVNTALLSGRYFAVRLEATVAPGSLAGFYGGNFLTPSLDAAPASAIPEPSTLVLLGTGLLLAGFRKRKR